MEKQELKEFVQVIQNKVSISVALAVICSKPDNLSIKEYAEELQEVFLQNWMKRENPSVFDDKILEFQQAKIFKKIKDLLLPPLNQADLGLNNDLVTDIPNMCVDVVWDDVYPSSTESDSDSDGTGSVLTNVNFMKAMVQLKFAVESSKMILVNEVQSVLQGKSLCSSLKAGEVAVSRAQCSEDSGFGDSASVPTKETSTVPSSIFRFVTHSVKTDALLEKCLSSMLASARHWILTEPGERFCQWRGSILEHLTTVFQSVADSPSCSGPLSSFVKSILDEIWSSQQTGLLGVREYQIAMLTEFCCNKYIIEAVINSLMDKFEELTNKLCSEGIYTESKLSELYLFEEAPLFLDMLLTLLKRWRANRPSGTMQNTSTTVTAVTQLWKRKQGEEKPTTSQSADSPTEMKWKSVCEKLITSSTHIFPLLSVQAWEVMMILDSD